MSALRPTVLTISLNAIVRNYQIVREKTQRQVGIIAVVKANAYGHGMINVAQRLNLEGARALAVATVDEGIALKQAGVGAHVLVLGGADREAAGEIVRNGLIQTVYDVRLLQALEQEAVRQNTFVRAHLKLDTGMSRIGVRGEEKLLKLLQVWKHAPHVRMTGAFTHFANAEGDPEFTAEQNRLFCSAMEIIRQHGFQPLTHAAASSGIAAGKQYWHDCVRPGIALYGGEVKGFQGLTPAQTLTTRPVRVEQIARGDTVGYGRTFTAQRPTRVMTLPIGYGDGYPRALSGKADVLVCGRRARVLGRVCMDQLMADVTDIPMAGINSEVVLLGAQGQERITPDELAKLSGTISYEIMLGFSNRVTRRVVD